MSEAGFAVLGVGVGVKRLILVTSVLVLMGCTNGLQTTYFTSSPASAIGALVLSYFATNSCKITQSTCPNHPTFVATFEDLSGEQNLGASFSAAECMQRAADYYNWCGGAWAMNGETTRATFTTGGTVVQTSVQGLRVAVQSWDNNGILYLLPFVSVANNLVALSWVNTHQGFPSGAHGGPGLIEMDVNGDGKMDLVQQWNNNGILYLLIYINNGLGYTCDLRPKQRPNLS